MAQVYSVNIVGYVNVTVPANKWAMLANPLNNSDNKIATVMPLPASADGTLLYRWDVKNQKFGDALGFLVDYGGWVNTGTAEAAQDVLAPGEGFFIQAPATADVNLTFVGEVQTANLTVPIPGKGSWAMVGSQIPMEQPLGDNSLQAANTMAFPAADGDLVYLYDPTTQNYGDAWNWLKDPLGDGKNYWAQTDYDHGIGPTIPVAAGFWVQKGAANPDANWVRTFSVGQ